MTTRAGTSFAVFSTPIGPCAIVWNSRGVVRFMLPQATAVETEARVREICPGARPSRPRRWVAGVIAFIFMVWFTIKSLLGLLALRGMEEVDLANGIEPLAELVQRAYSFVTRAALHGRPSRAHSFEERAIVEVASLPEVFDDLPVVESTDSRGGENIRLSVQTFDFGPEPLEVFQRLRRPRQDVERPFECHSAKLLQPAPGLHASVRWTGRQLQREQQPTMALGEVTVGAAHE